MAYKTRYKIKNVNKYIGNPSGIICRSLWERRVCRYLDENKNVTKWGSEEMSIPYYSPIDRRNHKYFPDFIAKIRKKDGSVKTTVIEVKPKKQTKPPKKPKRQTKNYINECVTFTINEAKWDAANKFCKKREWDFIILTEDNILP